MRIHIYNPEHDYALASGSPYYTPPAEVSAMRDSNALLPLRWADAGDAIVVSDLTDIQPTPGITLLTWETLGDFLTLHPDAEISPWGWDSMVRQKLISYGVPESLLPSPEWIDALRALSHRRTSIRFNRYLNVFLEEAGLGRHVSPLPEEFTDDQAALDWLNSAGDAFFKAPWSSSGRGVQSTVDLDREIHIRPWLRGIIRRQGSVMGETLFPKAIDFATEWHVSNASDGSPVVKFLGISSFRTSSRGKYHGNDRAVQSFIRMWINHIAPDFNDSFIEAQRKALATMLGEIPEDKRYNGFIGIDMMASEEGEIRGGVEINFRRTMGIPQAEVLVVGTGNVGSHLYKAFSQAGIRAGIVSSRANVFPPAELYIISVKDDIITEVAQKINPLVGATVAHTSGSVPLQSLEEALPGHHDIGVFYPLQTFSKDIEMQYDEIPFLIEGSGEVVTEELTTLARRVSHNVMEAGSAERAHYHLAAVLSCNFTNHLCTLAERYLSTKNLDFRMLLPLLQQTVSKLNYTSPREAQTGPAARGDNKVIESQLERLTEFPDIAEIYRLLTRSINNKRLK